MLLGAILFAAAYSLSGRYEPKIPAPPPLPRPNALDDYLAAGTLFEFNGGDKPMYNAQNQLSLLLQSSVVKNNQPALARLREGFAKECRIPFSPSFNADFEYLARLRGLARLLSAEADVFDAGGNSSRAVSSGLDAIELGADIQKGGLLIHGLAGAAIQAMGQAAVLPRLSKLNGKELDAAAGRMEQIVGSCSSAQEIMENERRWSLTSIARMDASGLKAFQNSPSTEDDQSGSMVVTMTWRFFRDRTLREMEKYMNATVREAGKPAAERKPIPEPGGMASLFLPIFTQAADSLNRSILRNRLLLAEIAIRRYQKNHGALPGSLMDLGVDPKLLQDPESRALIVYKPAGGEYLLYGIGPDGKDDGGIPADEGASPLRGDLGIRRFNLIKPGGKPGSGYRLVPHMKPPNVPQGLPQLTD